jgi:hypothetical protein
MLIRVTIVGIIGEMRMNGMDREIAPQIFWPMTHYSSDNAWIVVRSKVGPEAVADALRHSLGQIDPDVKITELAPMTGVLSDSLWRQPTVLCAGGSQPNAQPIQESVRKTSPGDADAPFLDGCGPSCHVQRAAHSPCTGHFEGARLRSCQPQGRENS